MRWKVNKTIYLFLFLCFFTFSNISFGEDFSVPHRFNPGDLLSSDVLNDILEKISNDRKTITADDILGDWVCLSYATPNQIETVVAGWETDVSGLITQLQNSEIVFSKSGDEYLISTSAPNPFNHTNADAIDGQFTIGNSMLYFKRNEDVAPVVYAIYEVKRISDSRIVLYSPPIISNYQATLICDRPNLPPVNPTFLSATLSDSTVSLTWSDDSDDETGFKILRRDSLTGEFAEISTASENATSYTDILTTDGKYWYRVVAVNDNGDSLGSNVAKVTLGDEDDSQQLRNELRMMKERMELIESELGGGGQ
jgi:hypothetical protein